jgi:hypothetical protein
VVLMFVAVVVLGGYGLAISTRGAPGARAERTPRREEALVEIEDACG